MHKLVPITSPRATRFGSDTWARHVSRIGRELIHQLLHLWNRSVWSESHPQKVSFYMCTFAEFVIKGISHNRELIILARRAAPCAPISALCRLTNCPCFCKNNSVFWSFTFRWGCKEEGPFVEIAVPCCILQTEDTFICILEAEFRCNRKVVIVICGQTEPKKRGNSRPHWELSWKICKKFRTWLRAVSGRRRARRQQIWQRFFCPGMIDKWGKVTPAFVYKNVEMRTNGKKRAINELRTSKVPLPSIQRSNWSSTSHRY